MPTSCRTWHKPNLFLSRSKISVTSYTDYCGTNLGGGSMLVHMQCGVVMEVDQEGKHICPKCGKVIKPRISRK